MSSQLRHLASVYIQLIVLAIAVAGHESKSRPEPPRVFGYFCLACDWPHL